MCICYVLPIPLTPIFFVFHFKELNLKFGKISVLHTVKEYLVNSVDMSRDPF